ncbi:MAG: hypothetical protein NVS3B26_03070 [Mycobacteriales bacterium]
MSRVLPLLLAAAITTGTAGAALLPQSGPAAQPAVAAQADTSINPVPLDWSAAGMYAGRAAAQRAAAHRAAAKRAAQDKAAQLAADERARAARALLAERRASRARQVVVLSAGAPRDIARAQLADRGWGDQFGCLDSLWSRESGWSTYASNPSGAYGIPQALPGSKMASAGSDWRTNPATQIRWGLGYIAASYGSPCAAWHHSQSYNWY